MQIVAAQLTEDEDSQWILIVLVNEPEMGISVIAAINQAILPETVKIILKRFV
jgi:hypothetical protein